MRANCKWCRYMYSRVSTGQDPKVLTTHEGTCSSNWSAYSSMLMRSSSYKTPQPPSPCYQSQSCSCSCTCPIGSGSFKSSLIYWMHIKVSCCKNTMQTEIQSQQRSLRIGQIQSNIVSCVYYSRIRNTSQSLQFQQIHGHFRSAHFDQILGVFFTARIPQIICSACFPNGDHFGM